MEGSGQEGGDLRAGVEKWFEETPVIVRALSLALVSCFVLEISFGAYAVATVPLFVVQRMEIYRVVLSPLFEDNLIGLVIVLFWLNRTGLQLEKEMGSVKFAKLVSLTSVVTNCMFCLLCFMLAYVFNAQQLLVFRCQGLFPAILSLLVIEPPKGMSSLALIPVRFSPQMLPWALLAFSTLLSGMVPIDMLCGIIFGYAYKRFQSNDYSLLPQFNTLTPTGSPLSSSSPSSITTPTPVAEKDKSKTRAVLLDAVQARLEQSGNRPH